MAVQSSRPEPVNNTQLRPNAVEACRARALPLGEVRIIDVEQRTPSKIMVWGAADDGKQQRSFECSFGTKITHFTVRQIPKH